MTTPARIVFELMVAGRMEGITLEERRIVKASAAARPLILAAYDRFDLSGKDQHHDPCWHVAADLIGRHGGRVIAYRPEVLPPGCVH